MEPKRIVWIGSAPPEVVSAAQRHRALRVVFRDPASWSDVDVASAGAVVLAFPLSGASAVRLLPDLHRAAPGVPLLIRDAAAGLPEALAFGRLGAAGLLLETPDLLGQVDSIIDSLPAVAPARPKVASHAEDWERLLVGQSDEMRQVHHLIRLVGARRATVLITGETGTGKEIAARALHLAGPRRAAPLVAVNCSALPENLLEDELFGHVRGAFTGAFQPRAGRFEQAQGGTIFLDEIGDMPLELQAKLLRVLQEREFQRLGGSESLRADVRVIAATNADLRRKIREGRFREDLYYRLNVVPIEMPPLRSRPGDIPLLAEHFVEKVCHAESIPLKRIEPAAMARLRRAEWPGNVRQLENAVEMAAALSGERHWLGEPDFPRLENAAAEREFEAAPLPLPDSGLDYAQTLASIERSILEQALRKTNGNKKAAAEMLRLKRTTLSAKVRTLAAAS